jgi:hypothetical protein
MGDLLYLVSIAFVGAATVGLFFGSSFLLLAQPRGQLQTESGIHDRDTEVAPLSSIEPSEGIENGAPSSKGVPMLISTASEAAIIGPAQTAVAVKQVASVPAASSTTHDAMIIAVAPTVAPVEPAPGSRATPVPPPRGRGSDGVRKLSRPPRSRLDKMPGQARAAVAHTQSAEQERNHDPEGYAAASANQQEYNQLHAAGPVVSLSSEGLHR